MNVQTLLDSKSIEYRESGKDFLVHCLNPDHEDTNPSMRIDRVLGIFNCWSCGYKGNIFNLYKVEADKLSILREKVKRKMSRSLPSDPIELPEDAIPYYSQYRGLSLSINTKFEFFTTNKLDLDDRLVIPLKDRYGNIYAFLGRDLYGLQKRKYLFYPKYTQIKMYPLPTFHMGQLVIVEGIFDAFRLIDNGITNVSCIFGVNNFTKDDLTLLEMSGMSKLVIMLDSDKPGQEGAKKIASLCLEMNMNYENIVLDVKDPDDLTKEDIKSLKKKLLYA